MAEITAALGSKFQATYAVEDNWGDLPSSYDVYNLRVTSFGVNLSRDGFTSEEIRSDRQVSDHRQGMDDVSGDVAVELSYGAFDDLIESAMFNTFQSDDTIIIGLTQKSLRLQKQFTDVGIYHEFPGCVVNSWNMTVEPGSMVTSTFSTTGKTMETTQTMSGAVSKASNAPFDSFSGYIREGTSGLASSDEIAVVTSVDFTLENNLTPLQVVGARQAQGLAEGRAIVTGNISAYFASSALLDRFLNETEAELEFQLVDDAGNTMTFYFPRIKYTGSDLSVDGEGPVTQSLPFQALVPSTAPNSELMITR